MSDHGICAVEHLNHVCIAVRDIEDTLQFYQDTFDVGAQEVEEVPGHGDVFGEEGDH